MRDVLFLDRHPGWSWHDLDTAPDDVIEALMRLDAKRAAHK